MDRLPTTANDPLPDGELFRRMAQRDATAFVEIQRRHATSLYALAYGLLMDAHRSEQVVAEVFEAAWYETGHATAPRRKTAAWLKQMIKERARKLRVAPTAA